MEKAIGSQATFYWGQNNWEKGTPNVSGVLVRSNTVSTQGNAGPLRVNHGPELLPEPLTFAHKSLQSELSLNAVRRSGVW